ncbi:hypothetical protein NHQ30_004836 [Ciborinia camelliae]|nr:hypothetical protein NHQ30_004836 [Ciborinia camelliae]
MTSPIILSSALKHPKQLQANFSTDEIHSGFVEPHHSLFPIINVAQKLQDYSAVGEALATAEAVSINPSSAGYHESKWATFGRKVKWIFIALFAAELVAYTAFEKYYLGRKFLKKLISKEEAKVEKGSRSSPKSDFNMVYAHYVMMGGFAANVSELHNVIKMVTITPEGVLFLSSFGQTPRISQSEIQDKSKSDRIGKGLVCLQVIWSIGQAIERKISGYPTTLLEVHTIVHVVCALFLYALWYQKPLNVGVPTIIDFKGPDAKYLAYMLELAAVPGDHSNLLHPVRKWSNFNPPPSHHHGFKVLNIDTLASKTDSRSHYGDPRMIMFHDAHPMIKVTTSVSLPKGNISISSEKTVSRGLDSIVTHVDRTKETISDLSVPCNASYEPLEYTPNGDGIDIVCILVTGQSLKSGCGPGLDHRTGKINHSIAYDSRSIKVSLSSKDVKRLHLAAEYMKGAPLPPIKKVDTKDIDQEVLFNDKVDQNSSPISRFVRIRGAKLSLSLRAQNMSGSIFQGIPRDATYLSAALALVPTVYGTAHIGALDILFPSAVERLLWKISCYYLIAAAISFSLWSLIKYADKWVGRIFKMHDSPLELWEIFLMRYSYTLDGKKEKSVRACFATLHYSRLAMLSLLSSGYVAARIYLVAESFISLRHVPIGVYQTPSLNIMGNLPHL